MAHAGGRPPKYNPEKHVPQVEELSGSGMTLAQIAIAMDLAVSTVCKWRDDHPEFSVALNRGKDATDDRVERSLYERAMGYSHPAVKIVVIAGKVVEAPYIERYPPDPTSMIFWLKNRRPAEWRERQEITHSGGLDPVQDMTPAERRALIASLIAKRNAE